MLAYVLALLVVLLAALLAFGLAALLHLAGLTYWVFVLVLLVLGIAAAIIIIVLHHRAKKRRAAEGEDAGPAANAELDLLLSDANRKLRSSQQGAKALDALPLLYILGDSGAAKTTTVLRSGLDPELLAGTASAETEHTPTPVLNLWYTRLAALLEIGASVRQSNGLLARLVHRTRARAYQSAFGKGAAPRAVLVCLGMDQLLVQDGGETLLASARATNAQLREISRLLGMPIPVYVIVTKTDRVPHFEQYVRNLSDAEVRQVLGAALPRSEATPGTYTDQASRRLTATLDALAYKLGEFRVEMLDRENEPRFVPGVYEFPREFGKLRKGLNQYLVELCKPSQLSANPYLRGFYFTGIRARIVEKVANAPAAAEAAVPSDAGATQFINLAAMRTQASGRGAAPVVTSARVPQWTFLPRLLPEVILGDKSALTATKQSAPARLFRRILYGTLAFLFALYLVCLIVSYAHNSGLEHRIAADARALPSLGPTAISYPSLTDLGKLDDLRQVILQLDDYKKNGAPLSYRWGLYRGDDLEARARHIYFDRFRPMFLNPAQANFTAAMKGLDVPLDTADTNSYLAAYNPLKAYLITTSHPNAGDIAGHPDPSDIHFLSPVFFQAWADKRQVDSQQQLAQAQIDFYGQDLLHEQPYSDIPPDMALVEHTRVYLSKFLAETRIYQSMLIDADKASTPIDFNRMYPTTVHFVWDNYKVRGAFSRPGFDFMQNALKNPGHYAQGERWVLGDQGNQLPDLATLANNLTGKYEQDYVNEWHVFLQNAHVANCGSLTTDTPKLLDVLTDGSSPLLELFFTVSHHTTVADKKISDVFQPAQQIVASDADLTHIYAGPGNKDYLGALSMLEQAIKQAAPNPLLLTDFNAFAPVATAADSAENVVKQMGLTFKLDPDKDPSRHVDTLVKGLLMSPIDCIQRHKPTPGGPAKAAGGKICSAVAPLFAKYPFSNNAAMPATLPEIDKVFAPDSGELWTNYNAELKKYLAPSGAQYVSVSAPPPPAPLNPKFLPYFNRLARTSAALYPPGQKGPSLSFTLHFLQGNGVGSATFLVDGQRIPNGITSGNFTWNGATAQNASLFFDGSDALPHQGTWAVFQLVRQANTITHIPGGYRLDYRIGITVANQFQDTGKTASFELTGPGAEFLVGDGFSGPTCVSPVN